MTMWPQIKRPDVDPAVAYAEMRAFLIDNLDRIEAEWDVEGRPHNYPRSFRPFLGCLPPVEETTEADQLFVFDEACANRLEFLFGEELGEYTFGGYALAGRERLGYDSLSEESQRKARRSSIAACFDNSGAGPGLPSDD